MKFDKSDIIIENNKVTWLARNGNKWISGIENTLDVAEEVARGIMIDYMGGTGIIAYKINTRGGNYG